MADRYLGRAGLYEAIPPIRIKRTKGKNPNKAYRATCGLRYIGPNARNGGEMSTWADGPTAEAALEAMRVKLSDYWAIGIAAFAYPYEIVNNG